MIKAKEETPHPPLGHLLPQGEKGELCIGGALTQVFIPVRSDRFRWVCGALPSPNRGAVAWRSRDGKGERGPDRHPDLDTAIRA